MMVREEEEEEEWGTKTKINHKGEMKYLEIMKDE